MASTPLKLYEVTPDLSLEEQANLARDLIRANELYSISNSMNYPSHEREEALFESSTLVQEVLRQLPNNCSALNLAARTELDRGHIETANSFLEKALKHDDTNQNTLLNYGYLLISRKKFEQAENQFRRVLSINAKSERAFSGLALAKLKQGDFLSAFGHYRRLVELGANSPQVQSYFLDSIEPLSADYYQADMEHLVLSAFRWEHEDSAKLGRMTSSLLTHKYQLTNEDAVLDIDQLAHDPLLLEAATHCLLPSVHVESLLTDLRRAVLTEVTITRQLRDELLPLAVALGRYAARNDYIQMRTQDEESYVSALIQEIHEETRQGNHIDNMAGALIILAMYEPLYTQSFSYQLLAYDLENWPLAMQALLKDSLYELSEEHQVQYELFGNSIESMLSNEVRRVNERWHNLPIFSARNYYQALLAELDAHQVPKRFEHDVLSVLLVGSGSGARACYLASCFKNLHVYALDNEPQNIAFGTKMARKHQLHNVRFIYSDLETPVITEDKFDIIEFGEAINNVKSPRMVIESWKSLLKNDGLLRLSFHSFRKQETVGVVSQLVQARNLSATTDNIRHLRNAIVQESDSGLWSRLFNADNFYTGAGCKHLFFSRHNHFFSLDSVDTLLKEIDLDFIGFVGMNHNERQAKNPLAPFSLLAWHALEQEHDLFGDCYHLYCRLS